MYNVFLKSRAENPHFMILGDIQNLAELKTKHKERVCKLRLNAKSILSKKEFNNCFLPLLTGVKNKA